jgi:acyl-coenzyme A synthetase/AMP-(fatty) acid ligase
MNVTDRLTALAISQPDAAAIQAVDGVLSFAELDHVVSATAKAFQDAGISTGDVVAIALPDEMVHMITSLGLARLGAGQVVIRALDALETREAVLQSLPVSATVTVTNETANSVVGASVIAPPPGTLSELRAMPNITFAAADDPDLPLFYPRSSGTTARPKLGRLTHKKMFVRIQPQATDGLSHKFLSLTHIDFEGAKLHLLRFLLSGRCVAFFPGIATSIPETIKFIRDTGVDFIGGSPVHASTLLDAYPGRNLLLPGLKAFRMSSTLVPEALRHDIRARLTPNLFVGFGITEIGTVSVAPPQSVIDRPGIVGWVNDDITVEVVDETGQPQNPGTPGELRLRSPGMFDGYIGDPEETAKRFSDGWFYSGDRCAIAEDGALFHFGRADDLIIYDGINIYPSAMESALLEIPAIAAVSVFGVEKGIHGKAPVAAVILDGEITREHLIGACKARLAQHVPLDIMIVDEFPMTTARKVIKRELAAAYLAEKGNQ